jgi:hypothetical protein
VDWEGSGKEGKIYEKKSIEQDKSLEQSGAKML